MKDIWWQKVGDYTKHSNVYNAALGTAFVQWMISRIGLLVPACRKQ